MAAKKMTFEESLARLDDIVRSLERGEATLGESMKLFEEGTRLIKSCTAELDAAEQKVLKLKKGPDGEAQEVPFDSED